MTAKELQEMSDEAFMNLFQRQVELQTRNGKDCNGAIDIDLLREEFLRRTNKKTILMGEEPEDREK